VWLLDTCLSSGNQNGQRPIERPLLEACLVAIQPGPGVPGGGLGLLRLVRLVDQVTHGTVGISLGGAGV
jgi:hypothetical protein